MNVGSLGLAGSVAGTQLAQSKGSDIDKAKSDTNTQVRATDSAIRADAAAGVGVTQEDTQTSDRDADGRRLWEFGPEEPKPSDDVLDATAPPALSKDPTGNSGTQLDLSG